MKYAEHNFISNSWLLLILAMSLLVSSTEPIDYFDKSPIRTHIIEKAVQQNSTVNIPFSQLQAFVKKNLSSADPMESLYREPATQRFVAEFITSKIYSEEITNTVLYYVEKRKLPISVVFSLVFVESSYSTSAVNRNKNNTKDIGLFQLNSNTFRHLSKEEFFHLETNVRNGTDYLAKAFKLDPNPQVALAIYNAGPSRPLRGLTPESTKKYVVKILDNARKLEEEFKYYLWVKFALADFEGDI